MHTTTSPLFFSRPHYQAVKPQAAQPTYFGTRQNSQSEMLIGNEDSRKQLRNVISHLKRYKIGSITVSRKPSKPGFSPSYRVLLKDKIGNIPLLEFELKTDKPATGTSISYIYHSIYENGLIDGTDKNKYVPGSSDRQQFEEHFADFLRAVSEGRTVPKLSNMEEENRQALKAEPLSGLAGFIPREHLTPNNLRDLAVTLDALELLLKAPPLPILQAPWLKISEPRQVQLAAEDADKFKIAADTLKTGMCRFGNTNQERISELIQKISDQFNKSSGRKLVNVQFESKEWEARVLTVIKRTKEYYREHYLKAKAELDQEKRS